MVAKVLKLIAVPAALGLASFRVYSLTEEKTDTISPLDLSIYSRESAELRCVEETAGGLQSGFRLIREGVQPYVTSVQNTCASVKAGATSLYQSGHDTYHFLREPPPGFLPRISIITVWGLAGAVLARRGSRFKRIAVPVVTTTIGTAVCYPMQTVGVLKVTGKKVYAASSMVASAFKSTPKVEVMVPDSVKVPEKVPPIPEGESNAASPATDTGRETAPAPEDSLTTDVATDVSPAAQAEVLPITAPENVIPSEAPKQDTPPPADVTACPPVKEKPQFAPNPNLLDHGQSHPEDADLYTTRG